MRAWVVRGRRGADRFAFPAGFGVFGFAGGAGGGFPVAGRNAGSGVGGSFGVTVAHAGAGSAARPGAFGGAAWVVRGRRGAGRPAFPGVSRRVGGSPWAAGAVSGWMGAVPGLRGARVGISGFRAGVGSVWAAGACGGVA